MSSRPIDNPFERFDIDPTAGVEAITEHMRELAADAPESQRQLVRDSWEALTLQPQRRIAAALSTFIDREPARVVPPGVFRDSVFRDSSRQRSPGQPAPLAAAPPVPVLALHGELAPARDLAVTPATDPLLESLRT
jgi:hypothetical protein